MYNISANSLFDQGKVLYLPSCHSTNAVALQLAHQQAHEGTLVITDCQTAGQGQRGNTWEAQPGKNLTFSFLIKPDFLSINQQFTLTKAMSLAVFYALKSLNLENISIKWPNDVYLGSKKVAGMLIQNTIQANKLGYSVVGIGLNVNQTEFSFAKATSLSVATSSQFDLNLVLNMLLSTIEDVYKRMKDHENTIHSEYLTHLYLVGKSAEFKNVRNEFFHGTIIGVNESGKLIIQNSDESISLFDLKEIEFSPF